MPGMLRFLRSTARTIMRAAAAFYVDMNPSGIWFLFEGLQLPHLGAWWCC